MSDDDLIRRGDALAAVKAHDFRWEAADAIAALPARGVGVKPLQWKQAGGDIKAGDGFSAWPDLIHAPITIYRKRDGWWLSSDCKTHPTLEAAKAAAHADYEARILATLDLTPAPDLSDPVTVHANMLRGSIAKPTVEQIVHLYGREAFQPMIDVAIAKALEKACLAVSEHADWPEDEHGRTEQVGLFARVINAIRAITPALSPAPTDAAHVNETPKSEHDAGNVLTDAAQAPAEDAHVKGETAGQMLERLGMDGAKWAAEFRTTALRLGYSDMDEGWLIGWFCNAIMAGYDRSAAQAREAALKEAAAVADEHTFGGAAVRDAILALLSEART